MSEERPLFRVSQIGKQFTVVNGENQRVSPFFRDRAVAEEICAKRLARADRDIRPCMCCGNKFQSDGPHNRLCGVCRWRGSTAGDPHRVAL